MGGALPGLWPHPSLRTSLRTIQRGAPLGGVPVGASVWGRAGGTFLHLGQGLLQLPYAALGSGALALGLDQPAAQACHLEVPVVLSRRTTVSEQPGG